MLFEQSIGLIETIESTIRLTGTEKMADVHLPGCIAIGNRYKKKTDVCQRTSIREEVINVWWY